MAFQDKTVVATLLNKTLGECEQLVTAKGWKHDEYVVYFPLTDSNQAKRKQHNQSESEPCRCAGDFCVVPFF